MSLLYLAVCIPYAVRTYWFTILALRGDGEGAGDGHPKLTGRCHAVSVIIPCREEGQVIIDTVMAALGQGLPPWVVRYEVVVVNDGSTDRTGPLLDELARHNAALRVIHRPSPHGKAAALNEGIRQARGDLLLFLDADHQLRPDAVMRLMTPLAAGEAEVVQGRCVVRNSRVNLLTRFVEIDNTVSYAVDLPARAAIGTCPVTGSTFACTRAIVERVGGFCEEYPGEDTEFSLQLMRRGVRVRYEPGAVSEDLAPRTLRGYIRQRRRWATGQNAVLFAWMRSGALKTFWDVRQARWEVLLYLFIYVVPVFGLVAGLGMILAALLHMPVLVGPWHSTLAVWLMAAYPLQLAVAACLRRTYRDILLLPLYVVRGPVESLTAVLGLVDYLRSQPLPYHAERAVINEAS